MVLLLMKPSRAPAEGALYHFHNTSLSPIRDGIKKKMYILKNARVDYFSWDRGEVNNYTDKGKRKRAWGKGGMGEK